MDVHDPVHAYVDLLCLLGSVHAAFTGLTCSTPDFCIQRSLSGSVCLHSNYSSSYWTCAPPYKLPLEAHLSQNYSIGHYNANGQYLGGWNFSLPGPTTSPNPIYLCMSARVNMTSAHYVTYCAEVVVDNSWQGTGCFVGIVPPYVVDGCYAGPASASTTGTTTTIPATDSDQPRVQTTVTPSTDGPPSELRVPVESAKKKIRLTASYDLFSYFITQRQHKYKTQPSQGYWLFGHLGSYTNFSDCGLLINSGC